MERVPVGGNKRAPLTGTARPLDPPSSRTGEPGPIRSMPSSVAGNERDSACSWRESPRPLLRRLLVQAGFELEEAD